MNIVNILEEIEKVDGEIYERLSPRRKAMQQFFSMGSKIAAAAMPLAIGSMFNKAYGQTVPSGVVAVLQYALTLEHFEYQFYVTGASSIAVATASANDKAAIQAIRDSEGKHVSFLQGVITQTGNTPVPAKSSYSFSAGTTFPDVMTNYQTFLAVAQVLEDTGVRAYKGRAAELINQQVYLTAALGIHAVEARHAAKIRYMRRINGHVPTLKPYITGANDSGVPAAANNYVREDATIQTVGQTNITITGINGTSISANAASQAFDEPLTATEVLALVAPFGVS